ncbi:ATP-binding protein [Deinococcus sp. AJ005]|uniref:ATP-binding protein n=1 Tax=Deinococcus sp. AJ005 TaxID=2652443 RepID=UPI00125CB121|nr:ATP-binding protein [Deinococcus sp. AJ005]QFP78556.1 ATP-binding protein [Deinococcus sp. AJ005]
MTTEKVEINSQGIRRILKKYTPGQAIAEYIWNGFDAGASTVSLDFKVGGIPNGALESLKISDNGSGISHLSLKQEFKPFFVSKKYDDDKQKKTLPHGKKGYGRLTFFVFATKARWTTVFLEEKVNKSYSIAIDSRNLQEFEAIKPSLSDKGTGTIVEFENITLTTFSMGEIERFLQAEFAFFLELNKYNAYSIKINGFPLKYDLLMIKKEVENLIISTKPTLEFEITTVQWTDRNTEFSNIYLINSEGEEVYKTTSRLNKKGDSFLHSVYIVSRFFDNFFVHAGDNTIPALGITNSNKDPEYKTVIERVENILREIRKPYLKGKSNLIINQLEKEGVFPDFNSSHFLEKYRHDELVLIVRELYIAEPRLFNELNIDQKKIFIRFLDLLLTSNARNEVFEVLESIVNLDEEEVKNLSSMIKRTSLESIINTVELIEDRLRVIENLKQLVFKPELNTNEKDHLQKLIEKHYWIFGEQFHLVTAEEPDFEEALRRYRRKVYGESSDININSSDKQKEMDIFAIRQNKFSESIEHIVVELKHPKINLGEKELSQVKRYMRVILSEDRFNAGNMDWKFYLIGNDFMKDGYIEGEIQSAEQHGERFLVYSLNNIKIYIIKWSEIITSLEVRFNYLLEKFKTKRNELASQATTAQGVLAENISLTSVMPSQIARGKQKKP